MSGCCGDGFVSSEKAALLNRLAGLGISMEHGRIWGPRAGLAWRLVGRRGEDPPGGPVGSTHQIRALVASADLTVEVRDGARHIEPR